jgi:predicted ATPase
MAEAAAATGFRTDVLDALLNLVDKGLVMAVPLGDEPCFMVLQTVRAYVAQIRSGADLEGAVGTGAAADSPLSPRERTARPRRSAA